MKTLKILFTLLLIAVSIISCSSNDDKSESSTPEPIKYAEENPLNDYMKNSGFNQKTGSTINFIQHYELGFSFKPKVKGKINAFLVKIPEANPALRVTLWNAANHAIIKSEMINVTTANVEMEKAITPIILEKGIEYFISFNTNSWISRQKLEDSEATYPITAGNILITGYAYAQGEDLVFPNIFDNSFYDGDITFKFQQTE